MPDGSIVINAKIDNAEAERDLKSLEKKIHKATEAISKAESAKLPLVEQAGKLGTELEKAKESLEYIREEMSSVQAAMAPGASAEDYLAAASDYERVKAALDAQEKEVADLQKQWDKVNDNIDDYNVKIQQSTEEIERSTAEAGRLQAKLAKGTTPLPSIFENAGKSANKFGKRLWSISKSVLVFSLLRSSLRSAVSYMGKVLKTNAEYTTQLAKLKAALLTAFQPIYEFVLPGLIMVLKVLTAIVQLFAQFLSWLTGKSLKQTAQNAQNLYNQANAIEAVGEAAKEASKDLASFDEINRIGSKDISVPSISGGDSTVPDFSDMGDGTDLEGSLKNVLGLVASIGAALLTWKISKPVLEVLTALSNLNGIGKLASGLGLALLVSDVGQLWEYFSDLLENGPSFKNVVGLLSELAGSIGDVLILLGKLEYGGALKAIQGLGEIIIAIEDISKNGINWENLETLVRGITNLGMAFGAMSRNMKIFGASAFIQGLFEVIGILHDNWDAIKNGDWSGVDKIALIISSVKGLLGLATFIGAFAKIKTAKGFGKALEDTTKEIGEAATGTGSLSLKLMSLLKNIGIGVGIIAEVAAAAILLVGAIGILGWELDKVSQAWQPVIKNAGTVAAAIGIGTGMLVAIGAACYGLGTLGATVATNIGIGIGIMAEIGIAAALFTAEIWAIGKGLDAIGQAWAPVLSNGESIETAIAVGTGILVGIGIVAAALGAVTIASAGTLPLAIGIGAAVLAELALAFISFTDGLVAVADELSGNLHHALLKVNGVLPELSENMGNFVDFMEDFATEVVRYTKASAISALASSIDKIVGWFSGDPIGEIANEIDSVWQQAKRLNDKLVLVNPELQTVCDMMSDYNSLVEKLNSLLNTDITLSGGMFVNMQEVGASLVAGLAAGMMSKQPELLSAMTLLADTVNTGFTTAATLSFTVFFGNMTAMFTAHHDMIVMLYSDAAAQINTGFVAFLNQQFQAMFAKQKTDTTALKAHIISSANQAGYGVQSGFITPTTTQTQAMSDTIRNIIRALQDAIVSSFQQAASGCRNAFSSLASWFTSNVYVPIASKLSQLSSQISSVVSRASSAISSMSSRSGFGGFFAKGGVLRNGWGIVGEAGPEIIQMVNGRAIITPMNIPYLAHGAVLPANKPFMAMVGDQKHGTNIEAPLETIQDAVAVVMEDNIAAMLAGFEAVVQAIQEKNLSVSIGDRDIGEANDRYSRRIALRRGS